MIPEVIQVKATVDFKVYLYFSDGKIKLYDVKPTIDKGGIFQKIATPESFQQMCTVLNVTLAWDLSGKFDPTHCIDLDPYTIYNDSIDVEDPLKESVV